VAFIRDNILQRLNTRNVFSEWFNHRQLFILDYYTGFMTTLQRNYFEIRTSLTVHKFSLNIYIFLWYTCNMKCKFCGKPDKSIIIIITGSQLPLLVLKKNVGGDGENQNIYTCIHRSEPPYDAAWDLCKNDSDL